MEVTMKNNIDELNNYIDLETLGDVLYYLADKMNLSRNSKFNNRNLSDIADAIESQYGYGVNGLMKAVCVYLK